jgi:hypothetical protein
MNNITLIEGETFEPDDRTLGLLEFTRKVLHRCKDKKRHGLTGIITVEYIDIETLFLYNQFGEEFIIRHEIKFLTHTRWGSAYTLMKRANVPTSVIELSEGYAVSTFS